MNNLRILALRGDEGGCGFYRINEPARVVNAQFTVDIEVASDLPAEADLGTDGSIRFHSIADVDVIIFQRPLLRTLTQAIHYAQSKGIACVVEVDDNFSKIHPGNRAAYYVDPSVNPAANYKHVEEACRIADWITVSTPALGKYYAPHGRFSVVRNCVPESIFEMKKDLPTNPRVGWSGTLQTHPTDLDQLRGFLGPTLRDWTEDQAFNVVGDGDFIAEHLRFPDEVTVKATGWVDLDKYYETMLQHFDIGIVPLDMIEFNQAKSYLKGLEMAALGIPFIASPTDEYRYLAEKGAGILASKGIEWSKPIKRMLIDRDFLLEEQDRMRTAVRGMTYENHAEEWLGAWMRAVTYRHSQRI